jgi:hypothetical protein
MVMKSTWEEKLPPDSSPPPEAEILDILVKAGVRGLPQPCDLDNAIVRDDDNLEVETRSFPENCKVALPASTKDHMEKMQLNFVSGRTSKHLVPNATSGIAGDPSLLHIKVQRQQFNESLEVRSAGDLPAL